MNPNNWVLVIGYPDGHVVHIPCASEDAAHVARKHMLEALRDMHLNPDVAGLVNVTPAASVLAEPVRYIYIDGPEEL